MKHIPRLIILSSVCLLGASANLASAQTVTNLYSFGAGFDGLYPYGALVQGSDGNFYGTTIFGGDLGNGVVYRITPGGSLTNLYSFTGTSDEYYPEGGVVQGSDGNFYGTTSGGNYTNGTVFKITPAGSFTNLYTFGFSPDGARPNDSLAQGGDGNFYGTTEIGGTYGYGTVFKITLGGSYTNLYSFDGSLDRGGYPESGVVPGSDGNLYGTTLGTVFRISPSGSFTNLYTFVLGDGGNAYAGLVQGSDGNFYGATQGGGTYGYGTVYRITPAGSYTNLYSFGASPDGNQPYGALVQGSDGNFYGATQFGGANGVGTLFKITPSGSYTNLYSFGTNPGSGTYPMTKLVQGSDGSLYGTCNGGGTIGYGVVYKVSVPLNPPANQISAIRQTCTNIVVSIPSVAGETYQLQSSTSMQPTNWVNVSGASITNSLGALLTVTNTGGAVPAQRFYRFRVTTGP